MSSFTELADLARAKSKLADFLSCLWYIMPADDSEKLAMEVMLAANKTSDTQKIKTLLATIEESSRKAIVDFLADDAEGPPPPPPFSDQVGSSKSIKEAARVLMEDSDYHTVLTADVVADADAMSEVERAEVSFNVFKVLDETPHVDKVSRIPIYDLIRMLTEVMDALKGTPPFTFILKELANYITYWEQHEMKNHYFCKYEADVPLNEFDKLLKVYLEKTSFMYRAQIVDARHKIKKIRGML